MLTVAVGIISGIAGAVGVLMAARYSWLKGNHEKSAADDLEADRVRDMLKQQADLVARNVSLEYEIKMKERDEAHAREMTDFRRSMIREMEKRVEEAVARALDLKGCDLVGACEKRVKPGLNAVRI